MVTLLGLMVLLAVVGWWAWNYADGRKRRERAQRRREEGDKVVSRILGK